MKERGLFTTGLLAGIRQGMRVVDVSGDEIGTVNESRMGDPTAVTTRGNELPELSFLGRIGTAIFGDEREPDVREPLRDRLMRTGFVKIEAGGWFGADLYAASDQVMSVDDDTVRLSVPKEGLIREV